MSTHQVTSKPFRIRGRLPFGHMLNKQVFQVSLTCILALYSMCYYSICVCQNPSSEPKCNSTQEANPEQAADNLVTVKKLILSLLLYGLRTFDGFTK